MVVFCTRTGSLVTLSNNGRTAQRNQPAQEFNNGVVISNEPLKDNQLFEVKIDKKINSWSGSIEIGVTTSDPTTLSFPTSATGFRDGTWIMSGCSVLKDGHTSLEEYGQDLDQLGEGDRIGILRTSQGSLHFYVNGVDQGQAAANIPAKVFAVVDMYGKCAQVSVVDDVNRETLLQNEFTNEMIQEASFAASNDKLIFHEKTGTLVNLSNGRKTAERRRPLDEFNNGVVMTNRPIKDDEMFEIRIDRLVDKWSGSIEVGITTHNPTNLDFPATMTNMRSGTIMMSGCGILTNGKGTRREYGDFNLDELADGDRIGLMRKSSGGLHYYINGQDQGVAATRTPIPAWGVVDLYGMAVKVTIIDHNDPEYNENDTSRASGGSFTNRANEFIRQLQDYSEDEASPEEVEQLLFHSHCGNHAAVINAGKTAHRPNAVDDFNNGVVLTSRHLRPGEMFDVKLDKLVDKWAGSIEIGVTTHAPLELDYPSTMTNIRTGTWMMTGNGVMHNGTTVLDEYGQNLDRLKIDDRVSALRKADGTLHFFVNGIDQGVAASNVPPNVYGVIDLYGQAAQATIIDHAVPALSSITNAECLLQNQADDIRFHPRTGRNAVIRCGGRKAVRPNPRGEFNDAIVMSIRPLKDNELFEVSIDKMVDRWSGSIEAGVTLIHPEDLELPSTMTDIDYDTWMLSGSAVMQDGSTVKNGYKMDLDTIQKGSRVGMMRAGDATLHFYLDGEDMGVACSNVPSGVYAVIDLYGQCAEVSITEDTRVIAPNPEPYNNNISNTLNTQDIEISLTSPISAAAQITHSFSDCCGKNVTLCINGNTATRVSGFNHGLVFSAEPLRNDELFEIKVMRLSTKWSGSLCIGLTMFPVVNSTPWSVLPQCAVELKNKLTWLLDGSDMKMCGKTVKENYAPSLERLRVGDRIGVKRFSDSTMHVLINGEDIGVAATNIPKNVFALVDLYGSVDQIVITSGYAIERSQNSISLSRPPSLHSTVSSDSREDDLDEDTAEACYSEFQCNHGKNIELSNENRTATRAASYNHGLVFSHKPLMKNNQFKIKIDQLNPRWTSSLLIGVIDFNPEKYNLPVSATAIKKTSWIIQGDTVFKSGSKIKENYGPDLDSVQIGYTVGLLLDDDNHLHLYINDVDQGIAVREIPPMCYAVVDLYGQCEKLTIVNGDGSQTGQDYKEKAHMEEGVKEKAQRHNMECKVPKNCDYQNLCNRFKSFLALPDGYFDQIYNCCFCDACHKARGGCPYNRKGDPPKDVAVPVGWYKFGIRMSPKAECLNVFKKWHTAYHGTVVQSLRHILDTGDLTLPEDLSLGGLTLQNRLTSQFDEKNKPEEDEDAKQISLSPTVKYAGCQKFAPAFEFRDPKTKKIYKGRVAFQVCIKPGSYKIYGQTLGVNEQIDPKFSNNEVDWSTKEKGAVILCALLVKVE